ncbi:PREDICTED: zinc finger protein 320-like, partial [Rhagoletis zephyria]|uniref:zinc finger protein 320-like n=1 Tax=Rhagoletis zephyria TaxID=28612 RepID=UPI0008115FBC
MSETYDMYDEFDCIVEEGAKTMEVKEEEEDSETNYDALESDDDQSAGNETVVKTEEQDESAIDMFDDEFHAIMEQDFSAKTNANETSEAVMVEEEHETDSDATEIDDDDHSAVSEPQQNTEPVVNRSPRSATGEQQRSRRRRRAKKSHKCQQCDKSFDCPSYLKRHQIVHTGIKAYQCPTCSK